jgi:hypothetical protein
MPIVRRGLPKHGEESLQPLDFRSRCDCGQSQPIDIDRPRCHRPKLNQILRYEIKAAVLRSEHLNRAIGDAMKRMVRLQCADEKVSIDQHARL